MRNDISKLYFYDKVNIPLKSTTNAKQTIWCTASHISGIFEISA
jgi:hypothetical protein